MATVHLPESLVRLYPGAPRRLQLDVRSVVDLMGHLDERWPGMRVSLCASGPAIREHINVFVDGDRAAMESPIGAGSVVYVMTAVSGG